MSIPARNQSRHPLNVPVRHHVRVLNKEVLVPTRQNSTSPPERHTATPQRPERPMIIKHIASPDQSTFLFALPMPPELPPAMTILLPTIDVPATTDTRLKVQQKQLALLLSAHNEELMITETIRSAVAAGQPKFDIYVVNDNSSDKTEEIAISILGKDNVLTVERSGKALAVKKAIDQFDLENRYTWLHIADADSIFLQDYFRHYPSQLDSQKYAVAVGFVQSLRGNGINTYRALTYTYSQQVARRMQSPLMISVFSKKLSALITPM